MVLTEHPFIGAGIRVCLSHSKDLIVAAETSDSKIAREAASKTKPALLLIDLSPPTSLSLTTVDDLHRFFPEMPILVFSTQPEALYAERALRAGAMGYVMEQSGCDTLLKAIRSVLAGQIYVSPTLSQSLLQKVTRGAQSGLQPVDVLTEREFDIFQLIGQGKSTRDMSNQLHVSAKTIAVHRNHIRRKLKLRTGTELIQTALRFCSESEPHSKGRAELLAQNVELRRETQSLKAQLAAMRAATTAGNIRAESPEASSARS